MYCPKCGTEIALAEAKFCIKCGQPLSITSTPENEPFAQATPVFEKTHESQPKPPIIGEEGLTELMYCASECDLEGCKRLLDKGADINQQDDKGATALIYAVLNNCAEVTSLLLSKDADQNLATKKNGLTPSVVARKNGFKAIINLLEAAQLKPVASIEPIWNPLAIVFWSFLFGPVWGVTLAWLNWKRLGDAVRTRSTSRNWMAGAVAVTYATNKAASSPGTDDMTALFVTYAFLWGYILLWVLVSHHVQISQVRASFGTSYSRRSWLWPIVIGIGIYVLMGFLQYWQAQILSLHHIH